MSEKQKQNIPFIWGLVFFIITLLIFWYFAVTGWFGAMQDCQSYSACHCETIRPTGIAQPTNTWSNLAFVFIGLYLLWKSGQEETDSENPIVGITPYSVAFGFALIFVGMGSFYFHGSMRAWANVLDVVGMNFIITFVFFYTLMRITSSSKKVFFTQYIGVNVLLIFFRIYVDSMRLLFFILFAVLTVILEISLLLKGAKWKENPPRILQNKHIPIRDPKYFIQAFVMFIVAFIIWLLWQDNGPFCEPDSWFQGHMIWHFLTAIVPYLLYCHLRSEK